MNFLEEIAKDVVVNSLDFHAKQVEEDPHTALKQVEAMLKSLYIRYGNDWTGRGIVGDTKQEAEIAGLEAVRAECLERIKYEG